MEIDSGHYQYRFCTARTRFWRVSQRRSVRWKIDLVKIAEGRLGIRLTHAL